MKLRNKTGFPGMRVLQFGFDGTDNIHLPYNYQENCIAYLGTHDNDTFVGYLKTSSSEERQKVEKYLGGHGKTPKEITELAFESLLNSKADVVIISMQDLLFQDTESRTNIPGTAFGQWEYRVESKSISQHLAQKLCSLNEKYGR